MGNVQDGSSETVKLYQDDATNVYFVNVGNQIFHGESFEQAVDSAIAGLESEA